METTSPGTNQCCGLFTEPTPTVASAASGLNRSFVTEEGYGGRAEGASSIINQDGVVPGFGNT